MDNYLNRQMPHNKWVFRTPSPNFTSIQKHLCDPTVCYQQFCDCIQTVDTSTEHSFTVLISTHFNISTFHSCGIALYLGINYTHLTHCGKHYNIQHISSSSPNWYKCKKLSGACHHESCHPDNDQRNSKVFAMRGWLAKQLTWYILCQKVYLFIQYDTHMINKIIFVMEEARLTQD